MSHSRAPVIDHRSWPPGNQRQFPASGLPMSTALQLLKDPALPTEQHLGNFQKLFPILFFALKIEECYCCAGISKSTWPFGMSTADAFSSSCASSLIGIKV